MLEKARHAFAKTIPVAGVTVREEKLEWCRRVPPSFENGRSRSNTTLERYPVALTVLHGITETKHGPA